MDILDILLATALTPQGQADAAAAAAKTAAKEAKSAAQEAITTSQEAIDTVQDAATAIQEVTETAQNVASEVQEINSTIQDITGNINNINNSVTSDTNKITYSFQTPDNTVTIKHYKKIGENEDGTMTQKAIKDYISSIPSSDINLGSENVGLIVTIGSDGKIIPGLLTEESIIRTEILSGTYDIPDALGIEIDYKNKTFTRTLAAKNLTPGEDFNAFSMYGNINRCLVNDSGEIICFYGDNIYTDNYSSGYQTMVYIPKFYYMRMPLALEGDTITKEAIMISSHDQKGCFKLHPAFINDNGEEVDYFLYSAYEGSTFDVSANAYNRSDGEIDFTEDKLASIVEAKPISGVVNELTCANAEKLATNRGPGWHITSIKAVSAIQMLSLIEFGTLNMQFALERGVSDIENVSGVNCSSYTGSTASLGNITGHAESTINEKNGREYTYTENGKRSVNYRGIENFYGNIWNYIGGLQIRGNSSSQGGVPYICRTLDFTNGQYDSAKFMLPNNPNWVSGFGYDSDYDWLFIPSATNSFATSSLPVGDYIWINSNLIGTNTAALGGRWDFTDGNGPYYYAFDRALQYSDCGHGARIMYIPQ